MPRTINRESVNTTVPIVYGRKSFRNRIDWNWNRSFFKEINNADIDPSCRGDTDGRG